MDEKEYILSLLEILKLSVCEINLPGFSRLTVLNNIKPDSFQFAMDEIKKYINEEKLDYIDLRS